MKTRLRLTILTVMLMMTAASLAQEGKTQVVQTTSGPIQGIVQEGTNAFLQELILKEALMFL